MFASATSTQQALPVCLAQVVGITAPAIYSSLTFAYSYMVVPPLIAHATPKILARQYLQAYQYAATFVPPLIISGTISNALLAYFSKSTSQRLLYGAAAVSTWIIMPVTLLYFEPNINGAGKWKVHEILQDEGYYMKENNRVIPYVDVHTGTPEARQWAEKMELRDIVQRWADLNSWRFVVTAISVVLSAIGTCNWSGALIEG